MSPPETISLHVFRRTPFSELVTSAAIICLNILLASGPRLVSDALFLEGFALSVVGATIACRIPERTTRLDSAKRTDEDEPHPPSHAGRLLLGAFFKQRNGFRILLVGLVLIGAAIVVGELLIGPEH